MLTRYALKKHEAQDFKLVDGQGKGLKGLTAAGSGIAQEKTIDTFGALIEQINKIFEDTRISDKDKINAFESVM